MINFFRSQKNQKKVYYVLAVVIVVTFGLSGIYFGKEKGNPASTIGSIGSKSISVQDYLASYKAIDHQARMIYGQAYDQVRPFINLKSEAWDRILLLDYAKKQGLKASDKEVVDWITSQPYLRSKSGFDPRVYKMFVTEYLRTESRAFEEEIRQTLTIQKITEKLEKSQSPADADLRTLYAQKKGARDIRYVVLPAEPAPAEGITEDELRKIYPMYQNVLTEPAKIRIRYVEVPAADREKMKAALEDKAAKLDDMAAKYGLRASETPFFTRNQAIPGLGLFTEIIDQGFALNPGKESDWIETKNGSYKIKLLEKQPMKALTFEEGREQLKEIYLRQQGVEAAVSKLRELAKDLKPADFDKFAADNKLEVKSFEGFKTGSYVPGIGPSTSFERATAQVADGNLSQVTAVPGGAAIVQVVKTAPIDEADFTKQKEALKQELARTKADAAMDELLKKLRNELKPNLEILKEIFPDDATGGIPASR